MPRFVPSAPTSAGQPTALDVDAPSDTMRRQGIDLGGPLRIVVIAGCHYSEDAARAVQADPALHALFARHAVWLAAPAQSIAAVVGWDREFPDMPMHVAWSNDAWPMLDDWSMPTYYVFRDGRESARFKGWHGISVLKDELRKAGALS